MEHETLLRSLLAAVFVVMIPIGIFHRVKSQASRESLDRRQEGLFTLATLRPLGAACWLGVLAWLINPRWMTWSAVRLPFAARWMGLLPAIAACALLMWTFRSLGANLTDTVVTRQQHTLVLHGPYRWVRHPLYGAAALLVLGIALIAANWFLLAAGVMVLSLLVRRTRIEEQNLIARFGDGYRTYMDRTGRFWPRLAKTR